MNTEELTLRVLSLFLDFHKAGKDFDLLGRLEVSGRLEDTHVSVVLPRN